MPVAWWIGPTCAAVLHVRRISPRQRYGDDADEDDDEMDTDVDGFRLVDGAWELWASGGWGWDGTTRLVPPDLPPDFVSLGGIVAGGSGEDGCKTMGGDVGSGAAYIELTQAGHTTRRRCVAPVGSIIVAAEMAQPLTIRVLDESGTVLGQLDEPAGVPSLALDPFIGAGSVPDLDPGA